MNCKLSNNIDFCGLLEIYNIFKKGLNYKKLIMSNSKYLKYEYYLNSSILYFKSNFQKELIF